MSRDSRQNELRTFFNRAAADWAARPFDRIGADRLLAGLGLREGDRVVDLGAGTGHLLPILRKRIGSAGTLCAIDLSWEMLLHARESAAANRASRVCGAAEGLPLPDESCDVIVCMGIYPHFTDRGVALGQLRRALRPGGRIGVFHAIGRLALNALHGRIGGVIARDLLPEGQEVRRDLESAGFQVLEVADHPDWFRAIGLRS
jgi:ubiquinone/menaquinone biosynthesis C-methylase UbiE